MLFVAYILCVIFFFCKGLLCKQRAYGARTAMTLYLRLQSTSGWNLEWLDPTLFALTLAATGVCVATLVLAERTASTKIETTTTDALNGTLCAAGGVLVCLSILSLAARGDTEWTSAMCIGFGGLVLAGGALGLAFEPKEGKGAQSQDADQSAQQSAEQNQRTANAVRGVALVPAAFAILFLGYTMRDVHKNGVGLAAMYRSQ